MFQTTTRLMIAFCLVLVSIQTVRAEDEHMEHGKQMGVTHSAAAIDDIYPLTVDPIGDSLVNVAKPIAIMHNGRQLLFANEKNVHTFKQNPDKYLAKVDALIIKQQSPTYPLSTCVVSGEKLGEMGKTIKRVIGNRLVEFCCPGCIAKAKKNPAKYFAKIDAAVMKQQKVDPDKATCPVSTKSVMSHGAPVEKVVGTKLVTFCCTNCQKKFEKNPAKYMSKLDK